MRRGDATRPHPGGLAGRPDPENAERAPYRWPNLSIGGEGLAPGIEEGSWEPLRDRVYRGARSLTALQMPHFRPPGALVDECHF